MLSPPIDNFKGPESLFQIEKNKGSIPLDCRYITNFHFSHFVSILNQQIYFGLQTVL